jgi:RNA polymerase sigma-70 factor (ECF subfamily)
MKLSEEIWREYHSRLRAFIKRRIADDVIAEDTLQNVFLKMHSGLPSLKETTRLQSWLYSIARNAIIDHYRSQKPWTDIPVSLTHAESNLGEKVVEELSDCLQPMIECLPEIYREAIILSELKGLKQREVAELQGTSLSGAKSRVQRGRALLKAMITDCCQLEFDHKGRLRDYERKDKGCDAC